VSDRRLRVAFARIYAVPPMTVLRKWELNHAHNRLRAVDPNGGSVTDVAMNLGFAHLRRFAGHYKDVFGESPSTTLAQHV
jgi:transcriptional regulator GlxA family with amidase domain